MRRRGCLMSVGVISGLLILCCIVAWFVGIPRLQDNVADAISESLATSVADQLEGINGAGTLEAGTYVLDVNDLQNEIERAMGNENTTSDFLISVDPSGMAISFQSGSQEFGYTGRPVAEDGELRLEDMDVNNSALGFIMPADKVGGLVEDAINGYFAERGLSIERIELGDNEITVVAVESGT